MADQFTPMPVKTKTAGDVAVKLVDSGGTNLASVSAGGAVKVDGSAVTQPVSIAAQIDTELPSAATLADGASAAPSTPTVGAVGLVMNGSTLDRQRAVVNGMDSTGTGIAAAGLVAQVDDTSPGTVTENQFGPVRMSTRRALLVEGVAGGTAVTVTGTVTTTSSSVTSAKTDTLTSASLAAGGNVSVNGTQVASGKTGKLMGFTASSSVPCKIELQTNLNGTPTTKLVFFTSAANPTITYNPPDKSFITAAESATAGFDGFTVKWTNLDTALAADVYATVLWDEV